MCVDFHHAMCHTIQKTIKTTEHEITELKKRRQNTVFLQNNLHLFDTSYFPLSIFVMTANVCFPCNTLDVSWWKLFPF